MQVGAYFELYKLLSEFLYGADAVLTGDQTLTLTILATIGALFVISLPFILVWQFIKLFV